MGLVVLDPVVVALAGFVRREGIWLAAGVMALDVTANWIGNWPSLHADPARLLGPVGLVPITLFGAFVLTSPGDPGHRLGAAAGRNEVNPGVHLVLTW